MQRTIRILVVASITIFHRLSDGGLSPSQQALAKTDEPRERPGVMTQASVRDETREDRDEKK